MSKLEIGDYFPFLKITLANGTFYDLMNCVSPSPIVFLTVKDLDDLKSQSANLKTINRRAILFVLFETGVATVPEFAGLRLTNSAEVASLLEITSEPTVYILTANRKIVNKTPLKDKLNDLLGECDLLKSTISDNVPYLLIDNVFTEEQLERIIKFYHDNQSKAQLHNSVNKNRLHTHPDHSLELMIDNKLSRSVFPEIKKIYNFDVKFRENYKICSYDASTNGRFAAHRDTPHPYGNRRYAMSLCLNDDYTGGSFRMNDYGLSVKMKRNSAIIFPGICSHEVTPVTSGSRMVIITFFTTKELPGYRVKSNYYDGKSLTYSQIYPI